MAETDAGGAYSLEQIGDFLLGEPLVLRGLSAQAYEQNKQLVEELRHASTQVQPGVLSLELVGSRAQGGNVLASDADVCAARESPDALRRLRCYSGPVMSRIEVEGAGAAGMFNMHRVVPNRAWDFIRWNREFRYAPTVLYHAAGVYDTPARRLGGLAALSIRQKNLADGNCQLSWDAIRENYADLYLGEWDRICERLAGRLGLPLSEVGRVITRDLMRTRREKFGLPTFSHLYDQEMSWLESSGDELADDPWHVLYTDVQKLLAEG